MDLITRINTEQDWCVDLVTEFFNGKYTDIEVRDFLYTTEPDRPRKGVLKLAEEFTDLPDQTNETVRKWYEGTDFYIFDLLPWNGAGQFGTKVNHLAAIINQYGFSSIVDFGGGLGTATARLIELNSDKNYYYVDLKDSVTFKFAEFFFNKLGISDKVTMMGDQEFFDSNVISDCIFSLDCFEHIENLEETFDKLAQHSNVIYHDSTFGADIYNPQHIQTKGDLWFANMAVLRNFYIRDNFKLLWRMYHQYEPDVQNPLSVNLKVYYA